MTTNRWKADRGYCCPDRLPKGPGGRALCRECQTEVPKGRRSFCSGRCVDSWKIRSDPTYVRIKLYERDRGVCKVCGLDCVALVKELERLDQKRRDRWDRSHYGRNRYEDSVGQNDGLLARLKELGISMHRYCGRRQYGIWDADHIIPVVEGGGEARTLDAFRTLCCRCHREETARLRKRLSDSRKKARATP